MVMAVIIFSMVLIYGYNAIKQINTTRQQVEIIEFSESLKSAIKRTALDYGSVKRYDFKVPATYKEVCFVDLDTMKSFPNKITGPTGLEAKSALIADTVKTNIGAKDAQNVFTIPIAETPIKVEKISVNSTAECPDLTGHTPGSGWICIPTPTGKLSLRLEGMGDRTCVREWKD